VLCSSATAAAAGIARVRGCGRERAACSERMVCVSVRASLALACAGVAKFLTSPAVGLLSCRRAGAVRVSSVSGVDFDGGGRGPRARRALDAAETLSDDGASCL
jgi:hypothetical protein